MRNEATSGIFEKNLWGVLFFEIKTRKRISDDLYCQNSKPEVDVWVLSFEFRWYVFMTYYVHPQIWLELFILPINLEIIILLRLYIESQNFAFDYA